MAWTGPLRLPSSVWPSRHADAALDDLDAILTAPSPSLESQLYRRHDKRHACDITQADGTAHEGTELQPLLGPNQDPGAVPVLDETPFCSQDVSASLVHSSAAPAIATQQMTSALTYLWPVTPKAGTEPSQQVTVGKTVAAQSESQPWRGRILGLRWRGNAAEPQALATDEALLQSTPDGEAELGGSSNADKPVPNEPTSQKSQAGDSAAAKPNLICIPGLDKWVPALGTYEGGVVLATIVGAAAGSLAAGPLGMAAGAKTGTFMAVAGASLCGAAQHITFQLHKGSHV